MSVIFNPKRQAWVVSWCPNPSGLVPEHYELCPIYKLSFPESDFPDPNHARIFAQEFHSHKQKQISGVIPDFPSTLTEYHVSPNPLTHYRLLSVLDYHPLLGYFSRQSKSVLNVKKNGSPNVITIDGRSYKIYRLVIFYIEGWIPPPEIRIVYKDGDKANLRYENLQKVGHGIPNLSEVPWVSSNGDCIKCHWFDARGVYHFKRFFISLLGLERAKYLANEQRERMS